uniref:Putative secreted protein n=1 Tax=Anopheles marajoara TaxID=58244 RepID=A0A2M4C9W6_9DIPT
MFHSLSLSLSLLFLSLSDRSMYTLLLPLCVRTKVDSILHSIFHSKKDTPSAERETPPNPDRRDAFGKLFVGKHNVFRRLVRLGAPRIGK